MVEQDRKWSGRVTQESNALDLEEVVFTWNDPHRIALSLKHSAEASRRRNSPPFRSAMSLLIFYINSAGKHLNLEQKAVLEAAKTELRKLYERV